jgi:F-type H+-transporting ATPase subunit a
MRTTAAASTAALVLAASLALATHTLPAQERERGGAQATAGNVQRNEPAIRQRVSEGAAQVDIITPHISDSHELEYPCFRAGLVCEARLPRWKPVRIGGMEIDLSPTKHVVMLLLAALLCVVTLTFAARAHERSTRVVGRPRGFAAGLEAVVLYLRNEVILPNVGPHGDRYVPFALTLFFFILFANLLGLIPFGSTATGNISVTATLAIITFVVIEISGMISQGPGYIKTIVYWPAENPPLMNAFMTIIMTPVEIISKLTKPFALAIRLFANMTAGHVVLLALISLIFTFANYLVAPVPILMGVAVSLLEIFVALLQAFIFTLLASVFIGQIRTAHH